ncbi:universal stress protein [Brevibacillus sp. TJ4]|uniref:universal stress protein n=1 Tax=Brevibacillus sp. TJ4 TaxID=3234853 RepID=UPI0037D5EE07
MATILVAVDHSEQSLKAVRFALSYAGEADELTLLHVIPRYPAKNSLNPLGIKSIQDHLLEDAHAELAEIKALAEASGVTYRLDIQFGDIPSVISQYAKDGYEALIMGTHGYGRVIGALMQSVSYPTLHDVQIPVFLISGETDATRFPWRKVLIAVDGSEHARKAVLCAIEASRGMDAEFTLMTVVPSPYLYAGTFGAGWEDEATLEEWGYSTLRPYEEIMQSHGLPYTRKVIIGDPAIEIRKTAEAEADLLVLGHHGQGAVAGMVMGSVTFKLIHRAKLPLLVVKK